MVLAVEKVSTQQLIAKDRERLAVERERKFRLPEPDYYNHTASFLRENLLLKNLVQFPEWFVGDSESFSKEHIKRARGIKPIIKRYLMQSYDKWESARKVGEEENTPFHKMNPRGGNTLARILIAASGLISGNTDYRHKLESWVGAQNYQNLTEALNKVSKSVMDKKALGKGGGILTDENRITEREALTSFAFAELALTLLEKEKLGVELTEEHKQTLIESCCGLNK